MRRIISYAIVVFWFLTFCNAQAAIFDVTNVAELQNALTTAKSNGQDDTINLASGIYAVSSSLGYFPVYSENFSLTIQGAGAGATILDGGNLTSILQIDQGAIGNGTNANIAIRGITFQNGNENDESSGVGGALYIRQQLTTTVQ